MDRLTGRNVMYLDLGRFIGLEGFLSAQR